MKMNLITYLIIIPVWLISGFAGISFLIQAYRDNSKKAVRGWWRKYLQGVRFRFMFLMGFLLIVWVIISVYWVLVNYRSF